jgi:hypothetical protein
MPNEIVQIMMALTSAWIVRTRESVRSASINGGTTGATMDLTELDAKAQADCNAHGVITQAESAL